MDSYIYFDADGRIRETVTTPKRLGDEGTDSLLVYWELMPTAIRKERVVATYRLPDGSSAGPLQSNATEIGRVPWDKERDLKFFSYGKDYQFSRFVLPTDVTSRKGSMSATVQVFDETTSALVTTLGALPFEVEDTGIVPDGNISLSQYNYLIWKVGENFDEVKRKLDKVSTDPQSVASAVKFNGRVDAANVNGGSPVVVKGGDVGVFARAFVTGDKGTVGFVPEPFYDNYASFYWSKEGNAAQAWLEEKAGSKTPLALRSDVEKEAIARKAADAGLQGQIDTINQSQNFVAKMNGCA